MNWGQLLDRLPPWLRPTSPWGRLGRPEMPERHDLANKQQELELRVERMARLEGEARRRAWREQRDSAWGRERG